MLSIENIIKLHDMGFSSEQIENINGLQGFEPEPKQEPEPEPKQETEPEPKQKQEPDQKQEPEQKPDIQKPDGSLDVAAIISRLDAIEKTFKTAMVHSSEQPKEASIDDILSVILSPSGEPLK